MVDSVMANTFDFDKNPELSEDYERGPEMFIPGYHASHAMAVTLLQDTIGELGSVLVLGAGGGVELCALAQGSPEWTFVGVDPSTQMLDQAGQKLRARGLEARVHLIHGYIPDAPEGPFDAATCFLALHFIPDDGERLAALKHIRRRLVPGAPFLMINGSVDKTSPRFARQLRWYGAFARRNGAPEDKIATFTQGVRDEVHFLSPWREEALLREAGFIDVELFYVGLMIRGWIAMAG
jgi:tRNA (cmo5U34)-methyltransferase